MDGGYSVIVVITYIGIHYEPFVPSTNATLDDLRLVPLDLMMETGDVSTCPGTLFEVTISAG